MEPEVIEGFSVMLFSISCFALAAYFIIRNRRKSKEKVELSHAEAGIQLRTNPEGTETLRQAQSRMSRARTANTFSQAKAGRRRTYGSQNLERERDEGLDVIDVAAAAIVIDSFSTPSYSSEATERSCSEPSSFSEAFNGGNDSSSDSSGSDD